MNSFPSRVLLATDGSKDAILAARVAVELSKKTDSELHVVHIRAMLGSSSLYLSPHIEEADLERLDSEAQKLLDTQVEQIEASLIVMGSRGLGLVKRLVSGRCYNRVN